MGRYLDRPGVSLADLCEGFQCHVSSADGPLVVLLEQDGADEAGDGCLVGEDADDVRAALDLLVEAFQGVGRVDLGAVILGKAHEGQHVSLGLAYQFGDLFEPGLQGIGDLAPLLDGGGMIPLHEGGADGGR